MGCCLKFWLKLSSSSSSSNFLGLMYYNLSLASIEMRFHPAKMSELFKFSGGFSGSGESCWSVERCTDVCKKLHPLPTGPTSFGSGYRVNTMSPVQFIPLSLQLVSSWGRSFFCTFHQLPFPLCQHRQPRAALFVVVVLLFILLNCTVPPCISMYFWSCWILASIPGGHCSHTLSRFWFGPWPTPPLAELQVPLPERNWSLCELILYFEPHLSIEGERWWSQHS